MMAGNGIVADLKIVVLGRPNRFNPGFEPDLLQAVRPPSIRSRTISSSGLNLSDGLTFDFQNEAKEQTVAVNSF